MSQIYNTDIEKLAVLLTPTFLRKERFMAWLRCLLSPIKPIQERFLFERAEDLYKLEHTAQVCSIEKVLNDRFDVSERRIRIVDVDRKEPFYIFSEAERTPKFINPAPNTNIYLYSEGVSKKGGVDFLIEIPLEVWNNEKTEVDFGEYRFYAIEAVVDYYKLASKKYKIILKNG
ncbi:hypothetical protein JSO59_001370 [Riemerella anatipestifer]|uniref:hypothetical protein n=1 Tax=Riemerella anatipestifer TaxID=34085 RepID=UPI0030C3067D